MAVSKTTSYREEIYQALAELSNEDFSEQVNKYLEIGLVEAGEMEE